MFADLLIASIVRRVNQRYLNVSPVTSSAVPTPTDSRNYLLYLHVPFCEVLCPFCSFHRVEFQAVRARKYFQALRKEIGQASDAGYRFGEVYVGGGTPTVLPEELARTIEDLRSAHPIERVSAETNPDHIEGDELEMLRSAGVNRLSVGVQSFDNGLLREMGRFDKYGSGTLIQKRLESVRGLFETLNVDMIFNFPHQTSAMLQEDLEILTDRVGVDQVSFYPLMIAHSTRRYVQRSMGAMDYGRERKLYEQIARHMLDAGYVRVSAWCFSRTTAMIDEYIAEHDEYLGLGSGSFSYLGGTLYASTFSINHYMRLVEAGSTGIVRKRAMSKRDQMRYYMLMRLFGGSIDLAQAEEKFGHRFSRTLIFELFGLRMLRAIKRSDNRLVLTESGQYLWVMMMREFFSGVNNFRDEMRHQIAQELIPGSSGKVSGVQSQPARDFGKHQ